MSLRNRAFASYDTVYVLGPVREEVLDGLPAAARRTAETEGFDVPREAALVRLADGVDDVVLIEAARSLRAPLALAVAGARVAVNLPHVAADGVEGVRIVGALLDAAASGSGPRPPLRPIPMPLARALLRGGASPVREYLAERRGRRALGPGTGSPRRTASQYVESTLGTAELAAIRRTSVPGRATPMTRAAWAVLEALRRVSATEVDPRIVLPVDLRQLVGQGRVDGNFVSAQAYGRLRTTEWSPTSLSRAMASRRSTGAVAFAAALLRGLLRSSDGGTDPAPAVSLSLMGAVPLPAGVFEPGERPRFGCATIGRGPGTFAFLSQIEGAVTLSVWDSTGRFDLDRFDAVMKEVVGGRPR